MLVPDWINVDVMSGVILLPPPPPPWDWRVIYSTSKIVRYDTLCRKLYTSLHKPLSCYLNFHPLEVVSRYRDHQLQVGENYKYVFNWSRNICKSWCLDTHLIPQNSDLVNQSNRLKTTIVVIRGIRVMMFIFSGEIWTRVSNENNTTCLTRIKCLSVVTIESYKSQTRNT